MNKGGYLFFVTPAFRNATATSKSKPIAAELEDFRLIEYLLGGGFDKWAAQPIGKLEGQLVKADRYDPLYLVLDEKLSQISSPDIVDFLFNPDPPRRVLPKLLVDRMPRGPTLGEHTRLLTGPGGAFLVYNDTKRHITSPEVFARYNFNWSQAFAFGDGMKLFADGPEIS